MLDVSSKSAVITSYFVLAIYAYIVYIEDFT